MKAALKFLKPTFRMAWLAFNGLLGLTGYSTSAQNVFEANHYGTIYNGPNPGGPVSIFATLPTQPTAMAFDPSGNLFVTQYDLAHGVGNIVEITPGGIQITFATGLITPRALAFDRTGNLFASDGSGYIYEYTPSGARSTFASGSSFAGLAFNSAGDLFASTGTNILEFTPTGAQSAFASGFSDAIALAFNSSGNLFVSALRPGPTAFQIIEIMPSGVQTNFASGSYLSLAFDNAGDLFGVNGNLDEYSPAGVKSSLDGVFLNCIAFQGVTLPVPEPTALKLMFTCSIVPLLVFCRRKLSDKLPEAKRF